jgi:glycopeptide antibiotics resistance protein
MFKKIAPDKWKHFYAGILMGVILQVVDRWLFLNQPILSVTITLVIIIIVSYGFELFSKITGIGRYDFMDAVASVIGGVVGMGIVWAVVSASGYYKI